MKANRKNSVKAVATTQIDLILNPKLWGKFEKDISKWFKDFKSKSANTTVDSSIRDGEENEKLIEAVFSDAPTAMLYLLSMTTRYEFKAISVNGLGYTRSEFAQYVLGHISNVERVTSKILFRVLLA